jgi:tRNA U38,U39,U40 pseudouridine synthase TruA
MVRRIVAAAVGCVTGGISQSDVRAALDGTQRHFGIVSPEPLFLMDVRYEFAMDVVLKPKVQDEWRSMQDENELRLRFLHSLFDAGRGIGLGESGSA